MKVEIEDFEKFIHKVVEELDYDIYKHLLNPDDDYSMNISDFINWSINFEGLKII